MRVEAEPARDLLAGRLRPFGGERRWSPVLLLRHQSSPTSRSSHCRSWAERIRPGGSRRIEACVHVREIRIGAVGDGRRAAAGTVRAARVAEAAPELQLETARVRGEEQRLEEDGRLGVLPGLLRREIEVLGVPGRAARDRLEDVRVDLGQRVVARKVAERVRQLRVAVAVVQRDRPREGMPGSRGARPAPA